MERRDFFKLVSTASTGLVTGACGKPAERLIPLLVSDREIVPGEEQWHPGVCGECPAGCGVIARVMEGERVIERDGEMLRQRIACVKKLEGNPLDPVSGGRLCARGQAALQGLYNPDRLRGPLRRVGPRGKADFARTSWEEAIAVAAEKLARVLEQEPARILFLTGPQSGTRFVTIRRFLEAIKAPPAVTFEIADFPLERKAAEMVYGWNGLPVYDLAKARYALGVGADFLGGWVSPVFYARQFGEFRQGRPGVRGSLTQAQSRFSITASSADQWLPLLPGSEPFFLAALGRLLVDENLIRQPKATPPVVLDALRVVDLAAASRACGVDEKRLRRLARELGESEAPLLIPGASVTHTNSLQALVAAGCLNLLLGNVGRPGGVLPPLPAPAGGRPAFANSIPLLERARFLFLDGVNPAYTLPGAGGVPQKLERIETSVSFAPAVDDSAAFVDLLLPDHHLLETTAAVATQAGWTLATPFVDPLYDTRATELVLAELAKKLAAPFEPATPKSLLAESNAPPWEELVRQGGFWPQPPPITPVKSSATLEVYPPAFSGNAAEFPLHFQPYLSLQYGDGRGANLPWMQELPDPVSSAMWGLPLEIDLRTAARLGIRNGDRVRVESTQGRFEAPAYVHPAAMPGVVSMAIGEGHRHYGRFASGRGANPLSILAPVWEKTTGALVLGATRIRLTRLAEPATLVQFSPNDREHNPFGHR